MFRAPVQADYWVYSVLDPAIDVERSDLHGYTDTLDPAKLVFREGEVPSMFCLRTPTVAVQDQIESHIRGLVGLADSVEEEIGRRMARSGEIACVMLRGLLRGVRNVEGIDALPEPGPDGLLPPDVLDKIWRLSVIRELAGYGRHVGHIPPPPGPRGDD